MTNAQIAARLARDPASVLHHVRTLTNAGFLEALPAQKGPRGARTVPYRATRKSWAMQGHHANRPMVEAFGQSAAQVSDEDLDLARGVAPRRGRTCRVGAAVR